MKIAAKDRMARLIAAIPWIVAQDGASVDEISDRFNYPRDLLLGDLQDVVFYVGVPPYTPDTLIEVTIDDDMVWISYADWFARPMRLSGAEILSLVAAGETALAFDNQDEAGALARGLTKLRLATGSDAETVDVSLGHAGQAVLPTLRAAAAERRCVDMSYYSFGRDEHTERRIEPARFFVDGGNWYVSGFCHRANAERIFRVDRIDRLEATAELFTTEPVVSPDATEGFALADAPRATLNVPNGRARVLDGVPVDSRTSDGDTVTVVLPVLSTRWLEQLLLRIGPEATLTTNSSPQIERGAAAQRILARYDA